MSRLWPLLLLALTAASPAHHRGCIAFLDVVPGTLGVDSAATGSLTGNEWTVCATIENDSTVAWSSEDTTIATVLSTGTATATVTGVRAGSVYIVGSVGAHSDSSLVTVHAIPVPTDTTLVSCAGADVTFSPGDSVADTVAAYPAGTHFCLPAGTYRAQSITPKTGDVIVGESGAILDGGRTLTGWTASGGYFYKGGQTQQGTVTTSGSCDPSGLYPRCKYPEQLWKSGTLQKPEATLAAVGAGEWFFDYTADRIYVPDTTGTIETSVTPAAFTATANDVTVSGLTLRHYAPSFGNGVVNGTTGTGWLVRDNTCHQNGGACVRIEADGWRVIGNRLSEGGQWGVSPAVTSGSISGLVIDSNEVDLNNTAHWATGFGAGGMKLVRTDTARVRHNNVHDNLGTGVWCDIENRDCRITGNTVADNDYQGIFIEISYGALIDSNTVTGNGYGRTNGTCFGAGILVAASPDVEIRNNTLSGNHNGICGVQQARGSGAYGPHEIENLYVHDNSTTLDNDTYSGLSVGTGDATYFTSRNNRFLSNSYVLPSVGKPYTWQFNRRTQAEWTAYGED